ncbi:acetate--CoA ligase family protein [Nocardioides koreensis]|uniref:Acetate--CoA ligase family protein n=1 Tax=Nocardioides koreensis TaxID=433651 RepID=A0ABN2ZX84_9ACTN
MALATVRPRLRRMLEARTVAVVGAGDRPDSLGWRMTTEVLRSPGVEKAWLVNPRHRDVAGHACLPSLADVPDPVDLVLLGVPDAALVDQVRLAAARGDGGGVVFGSAHGLGEQLVAAADGLEVCGAGCMGFVDVTRGVRALGYLEPEDLTPGPIALVTHSGSVFSALLRTHRRLEYSLVVSSGQELVTTTADYLAHALEREETRVVGLVQETMRDVPRLRAALAEAADRDIPVVALTVGSSRRGRDLVGAHSGALAGSDAAWEALTAAYGVHRCDDLGELVDSLEAFAIGRRVRARAADGRTGGIATVHDSGAERVLVADVADRLGIPFAGLSEATTARLAALLDPGLEPTNPLDVWGNGSRTEDLFAGCLTALADDDAVDVVALAVDLVPEYDGDDSFPRAVDRLVEHTDKPVAVLTNLSSAVDQPLAADLRGRGVPVLEGTRSGLRALGHLLAGPAPVRPDPLPVDRARRDRWAARLGSPDLDPLALVADYGLPVAPTTRATDPDTAVRAAERLGYPVVLKTAASEATHKVDVDGVRLGLADAPAVAAAYAELAARLGPCVTVQRQVPAGVEIALGMHRDPLLGPLVVVGAGGTLVELLAQRAVALPPVDGALARRLLGSLKVARLLAGHRGGPALPVAPVVEAVVTMSTVVMELGDLLAAVDVNPLIVHPGGAVAVDALVLAAADP